MVRQQLDDFLAEEGYTRMPSNLPEFTIYFHPENNCVNVVHVIDYRDGLYISQDQYGHIKEKIIKLFTDRGITNIHILSLIVSGDIQKAKQLCGEDALCWLIDACGDRLLVYENQASDFYGLRGKIDYLLNHLPEEKTPQEEMPRKTNKYKIKKPAYIPAVTILLVSVNILAFIICTFTGELLYNIGAFRAENFLIQREYYRIVTSMFLHWDVNHLFGNMIILFYLGETVEKYFGHIRFGILYFISGICGNLLSMGFELYTGSFSVSAGASGAIFGVIGALLFLVLVHRGHLEQITLRRLVIMIVYSLYSGFAGSNINNAAHIGGFLSGIVATLLLWVTGGKKKKAGLEQGKYES